MDITSLSARTQNFQFMSLTYYCTKRHACRYNGSEVTKHNIKTIPHIWPRMCITVQGRKIILSVIYFSWEMLNSIKCDHVNLPGLIEFIIPLQYTLRWHNLTSTNLTLLNHRTATLHRHITSELKHNQFFPLEGNFLGTECALKSQPSLGNHANDWLVIIILHILV